MCAGGSPRAEEARGVRDRVRGRHQRQPPPDRDRDRRPGPAPRRRLLRPVVPADHPRPPAVPGRRVRGQPRVGPPDLPWPGRHRPHRQRTVPAARRYRAGVPVRGGGPVRGGVVQVLGSAVRRALLPPLPGGEAEPGRRDAARGGTDAPARGARPVPDHPRDRGESQRHVPGTGPGALPPRAHPPRPHGPVASSSATRETQTSYDCGT